ncbi:MAG: 16S rRNA (adenine(1518)-N(6)/adenine(1519)-N(6))-dimethyltransferase RsmA [Candidatus Eremiobacterota bacterium]
MTENIRANTLKELKRIGVVPKKNSKGQHFLIDSPSLETLVYTSDIIETDHVFEIGAGTGNLTMELAKTGASVVALEKDLQLLPLLEEKFKNYSNVKIVQGDFKKINMKELLDSNVKWKVVANLPYYITNYIIVELLEEKQLFSSIVVTIQKEVAERLTASPGNKVYGSLTVFAHYHGKTEIAGILPPKFFLPRPQVDSAIVKISLYETPPVYVKDEKVFFELIRSAFNMRRKTIRNAWIRSPLLKCDSEEIDRMLSTSGIDGKRRGETFSLEEFAEISNILYESRDA